MSLTSVDEEKERRFREAFMSPLRICSDYQPNFGRGKDVTLSQFHTLYEADPLYHWIGIDSDFMYAAHKAAGGMTSIYRQLGTGCERLVRAIMMEQFGLQEDQIDWAYEIEKNNGEKRTLSLDARLDFSLIPPSPQLEVLKKWTIDAAKRLQFSAPQIDTLVGSVFEIRQGYKSQDAKRQNTDIQSAMRARNDGYVFVMPVLSSQISKTLRTRYLNSQMLVLVGNLSGDPLDDTFAFIEQVVGYPITDFFNRNSDLIREEVEKILQKLLSPG